jgi:hypothetical protein
VQLYNLLFSEFKHSVFVKVKLNLLLGSLLAILFPLSLFREGLFSFELLNFLVLDCVSQSLKLAVRTSCTLQQVHQGFRPRWHPISTFVHLPRPDLVAWIAFGVDAPSVSIK